MPIVSIMPNNGQKAKNDGQIAKKAFMMFAREEKTEIGTWITMTISQLESINFKSTCSKIR